MNGEEAYFGGGALISNHGGGKYCRIVERFSKWEHFLRASSNVILGIVDKVDH